MMRVSQLLSPTHCHEAPCKLIFPVNSFLMFVNSRVAECLMTREVAPVAPALSVEEVAEVGPQVHPQPDSPFCQ